MAEEEGLDERALRAAILRGDEDAWRALYARAFAPLWAYVVARTRRNVAAAEEVVQEAWMVAVRRIADFDPSRAPFEAWVKGIAANVLRNHRRTQQRALKTVPLRDVSAAAPEASDARERVTVALTSLPWMYQQVLRAKYEERLPVAAIAARMGRTDKSIESLLTRARAALRDALGGGGETP